MDVEKLIKEVHAREAIWDQAHKDHHNRFVLDKCWDAVSQDVKCSKDQVRSKWRYLRETFGKKLLQIEKKRPHELDSLSTVKSSWEPFNHLHFLKDQFPGRKSTNFKVTGNEDHIYCDETMPLEVLDTSDEHTSSTECCLETDDNNPKRLRRTGNSHLSVPVTSKRKYGWDKAVSEDSMFFESLLPHVSKISQQKKLIFRSELQKLVQKFAYEVE